MTTTPPSEKCDAKNRDPRTGWRQRDLFPISSTVHRNHFRPGEELIFDGTISKSRYSRVGWIEVNDSSNGWRRQRVCIEMEANIELSGANPSVRPHCVQTTIKPTQSFKSFQSFRARTVRSFPFWRWKTSLRDGKGKTQRTAFVSRSAVVGLVGWHGRSNRIPAYFPSNTQAKGQILKQGNRI